MISFDRVTARYPGSDRDALSGVSFVAQPGELTAVVGPNGSGKTTLVRTLLGRVVTTGGEVHVGGRTIAGLSRRETARLVAVVVQREEPVFPMRVRDYLALAGRPMLGAWSNERKQSESIMSAAIAAGVASLLDRSTDRLSGGEWQRVRVARGLAQETAALVIDEPTSALDIAHEMQIFGLLADLRRDGRTVMVVSHQLDLVARFADRIVLLSDGRIAALGTTREVLVPAVLEDVYGWPLAVVHNDKLQTTSLIPLMRPQGGPESP
ncbi:MAG: ABC transporter ATP-binding protein [Gemmatimonadota bacterium]